VSDLPRYPAAPTDGTQWRHEWRICLITRRLSDARLRDAIWADAVAEHELRSEAVDVSTRAMDEADSQARYDDNDEGGSRNGRE